MTTLANCFKFAKKGDIQKLSQLLDDQPKFLNQIDPKLGIALIHFAIQNSDQQLFNFLIKKKEINTDLPSRDKQRPLQVALRLNDSYMFSKLLDVGANIKLKTSEGQTFMAVSIKNQTHPDILKKLLTYFDIDQPVQKYGSYLNLAVASSQIDNFIYLLKHQRSGYILRKDNEGNNCLQIAIKNSNGHMVKQILTKLKEDLISSAVQKQFFINNQNNQGNTAIHMAVSKNLQTITQMIEKQGIQLGLDTQLKNKNGLTVKQLKQNFIKNIQAQQQAQKRKKSQQIIRKKQKQQEKIKNRIQQQRLKQQQKKQLKQIQQRQAVIQKIAAQNQRKKVFWCMAILFLSALGGMYIFLQAQIARKQPVTL